MVLIATVIFIILWSSLRVRLGWNMFHRLLTFAPLPLQTAWAGAAMRLRLKSFIAFSFLSVLCLYCLLTVNFIFPNESLFPSSVPPSTLILIPVINTNPRRQRRLQQNICDLVYPAKSGVEITFSADLTSAALISLPALVECGYTENNLSVILEKSDEDELQPKEAEMRHAYGSQAARRAKIAQARNNLLRSSLRARHNHVYWLDR